MSGPYTFEKFLVEITEYIEFLVSQVDDAVQYEYMDSKEADLIHDFIEEFNEIAGS